jgi:3'-phosphoadenosine 5'-phosphosulfate sulfotransferase (PAPS reductase)/FAD synthetase
MKPTINQRVFDLEECAGVTPPKETDQTRYVVGISGGKDSTAVLLWMIYHSGISKDKIICTFSDTGNEHEWTYAHVEKVSKEIHPVTTLKPDRDFYELAFHKKRFPSTKARFCTQFLKIEPTEAFMERLIYEGYSVVSVSGVRANESADRKGLPEWDYAGYRIAYIQWRPIIRWTIEDVLAIHAKYDFPLNPLYAAGAQRVGCYPCIMSRKSEIRTIALRFPERIDMIREAEQRFEKEQGRYGSFFPRTAIPHRFRTKPFTTATGETMMVATIDDVVRWSMSGKGAKGKWDDDDQPPEQIGCMSGFCE